MITTWVLLALVWTACGVGWYSGRKWMQIVRGWRDTCKEWEKACMGWKKIYRQEEKISKRWRDLYKGREVFMPFNTPADGKLDGDHWEAVTVTTTSGDGAPTETMTGEEKP